MADIYNNGTKILPNTDSSKVYYNYTNTESALVKLANSITREDVVKRFSTPCISIIDDDFIVRENDSLNRPRAVNKLKLICDDIGVKISFAVIPEPEDINHVEEYISSEKAELIRSWLKQGYQFELHPNHQKWGYDSQEGYGNVPVEQLHDAIYNCVRAFKNANVPHSDMIVLPSGHITKNVLIATKQWVSAVVNSAHIEYNEDVQYDLFHLNRRNIVFTSTTTVQSFKDWIDEGVRINAWMIFCTHCDQFNYTEGDVMNWNNLQEVISYAKSVCPIKPFGQVLNERKQMFDILRPSLAEVTFEDNVTKSLCMLLNTEEDVPTELGLSNIHTLLIT